MSPSEAAAIASEGDRRGAWIAAVAAVAAVASIGGCASKPPLHERTGLDTRTLDGMLGPDVVGEAIPALMIADPALYAVPRDGTWVFHAAVDGPDAPPREHRIDAGGGTGAARTWTYADPRRFRLALQADDRGSVWIVGEDDLEQGVTSTFSPPEPFLLAGLEPGEEREMTIAVTVTPTGQPEHVIHHGSLELTFRYVGAFEVTVPAGEFEAVLIAWHYRGEVGPAHVDHVEYRLFAPGEGTVAMVSSKYVSALGFYRKRTDAGLVLLEAPPAG